MSLRFTIRTLLTFAVVAAVVLTIWGLCQGPDENAPTNRFHWNRRATGIAAQRWDFGWQHSGNIRGLGACVILHHYRPKHKKYGQNGGYKLAIQLPAELAVGDKIQLTPVPLDRPGEAQPHDFRYTLMQPYEFTAETFGDHIGRIVKRSSVREAAITIDEMTDTRIVIHAAFDITIPEFEDLEIDRTFNLEIVPRGGG